MARTLLRAAAVLSVLQISLVHVLSVQKDDVRSFRGHDNKKEGPIRYWYRFQDNGTSENELIGEFQQGSTRAAVSDQNKAQKRPASIKVQERSASSGVDLLDVDYLVRWEGQSTGFVQKPPGTNPDHQTDHADKRRHIVQHNGKKSSKDPYDIELNMHGADRIKVGDTDFLDVLPMICTQTS